MVGEISPGALDPETDGFFIQVTDGRIPKRETLVTRDRRLGRVIFEHEFLYTMGENIQTHTMFACKCISNIG